MPSLCVALCVCLVLVVCVFFWVAVAKMIFTSLKVLTLILLRPNLPKKIREEAEGAIFVSTTLHSVDFYDVINIFVSTANST